MTTAVDPENSRPEVSHPEDTPIEGTVFTSRQVRLLKFAVVAMGVLLLAGFAAMIAGMVFQASKMTKKSSSPAPAVTAPAVSAFASALTIPEGGEVAAMALDGDRLAVHIKTPEGGELAVVDLAIGKVVSRVKIERGAAPAQ